MINILLEFAAKFKFDGVFLVINHEGPDREARARFCLLVNPCDASKGVLLRPFWSFPIEQRPPVDVPRNFDQMSPFFVDQRLLLLFLSIFENWCPNCDSQQLVKGGVAVWVFPPPHPTQQVAVVEQIWSKGDAFPFYISRRTLSKP